MRIILASKSLRRKELLEQIVPEFEIIESSEEEKREEGLEPGKQVEKLAYVKAKNVYDRTTGDRIIIGSDTMVTKNGKMYGKPKSKENAKEILKALLQGDRMHEVVTGLAIIIEENGEYREYKTFDKAKVYFKDMEDSEIEKWINTGKAMDKAGAYGINTEFGVFIEKIEGNYTTVVGFPMHKVYDVIKKYI